jgi:hypothetical protein
MVAAESRAQVTVAEGYTPPDDTPKINLGITLFADYTYQDTPTVTDGVKSTIHRNSFNLTRAYINVTGNLSHWLAFRITPDIKAENGTGTSLTGNQTLRLKYGYGQINLDDLLCLKGTWLRFGLQQTPWIDFEEGVYRYRFQGPIFADTEGFLTSSDYGASVRIAFPGNFGDVHAGVYNGDGYQSQNDQNGTNNEKSFQIRGTLRPLPMIPFIKGLRLTGFYDSDHYFSDAKRERIIGALTFEHPYVNAGFEWDDFKDQLTPSSLELHRDGYSAWITPRTQFGLEGLFRYDELRQNKDNPSDPKKKRMVYGIAYWPPLEGGKTVSFLFDYSEVKFERVLPDPGKTKIYALHTLFNF